MFVREGDNQQERRQTFVQISRYSFYATDLQSVAGVSCDA